jgi:hypothetical protein
MHKYIHTYLCREREREEGGRGEERHIQIHVLVVRDGGGKTHTNTCSRGFSAVFWGRRSVLHLLAPRKQGTLRTGNASVDLYRRLRAGIIHALL